MVRSPPLDSSFCDGCDKWKARSRSLRGEPCLRLVAQLCIVVRSPMEKLLQWCVGCACTLHFALCRTLSALPVCFADCVAELFPTNALQDDTLSFSRFVIHRWLDLSCYLGIVWLVFTSTMCGTKMCTVGIGTSLRERRVSSSMHPKPRRLD